MAIYSLSVSNVSRGAGSSTLATLSYITARRVRDVRLGLTFYGFGRRERVLATGTVLPAGAPVEWSDAEVLFNSVEVFEKSENARCGKKIIVALAREWSPGEAEQVLREFIEEHLTSLGYGCAYAVHVDREENNPHAHILVANRVITKRGDFGAKAKSVFVIDGDGNRVPIIDKKTGVQKVDGRNRKQWKRQKISYNPLDSKDTLQKLREGWEQVANRHLDAAHQIDHRSLKDQGVDRVPTVHEGYAAQEMMKRGEDSDRAQLNVEVAVRNEEIRSAGLVIEAAFKRIRVAVVQAFRAAIDPVRLNRFVKTVADYARGLHDRAIRLAEKSGDYVYQSSIDGQLVQMRGAELGVDYTKASLDRVFSDRQAQAEAAQEPSHAPMRSQEASRSVQPAKVTPRTSQTVRGPEGGLEARLRVQAGLYDEQKLAALTQQAAAIEKGGLGGAQQDYQAEVNRLVSLVAQVDAQAREAQQANVFKRGKLARQAQQLAEHNTATLHQQAPWTVQVTIPPTGGYQAQQAIEQATRQHYYQHKAVPELAKLREQISQQETYKAAHDQIRQADQLARASAFANLAAPAGARTPTGRIKPRPRPDLTQHTQHRGRSL